MGIRCVTVAVVAALVSLAAPAASAQAPPTILSAGIDARDALYATWSVAPGSTFDFVTFATVPDPNPELPNFFADGNFAGFCDPTLASPTCTATSYVAPYSVGRDRRYFVKVSAEVGEDGGDFVSSAVWVIDGAKPLIPGPAPAGADPPTGAAVAGHPLGSAAPPPPALPPPPPAPTPAATIKLLTVPRTIGALLARGVRLRVACTVRCSTTGRLTLGPRSLGAKSLSLAGAGTRVLTVKPARTGRARLRGRSRARVKIAVAVTPAGGTTARLARSFSVRR